MNVIERDELAAKIDRGDDFKLVMVLSEWAYRAAHIPGSLHISTPDEGLKLLKPEDEIVVYCSDEACIASQYAYQLLERNGYTNIRRYSGGLSDWAAAGLPLDGEGLS